jgi:hypothetical protein
MKQLVLFSSILFLLNGCNSIKVLKSYNYTYYILNTDRIAYSVNSSNICNDANFLIISKIKAIYNYDPHYYKKQLSFIKEKDTMNIYCLCGQGSNYYLKDLQFKKGDYFLSFNYERIKEVKGSQLNSSTKLQNILFEDYKKISSASNPRQDVIRDDVYFRNLIFKIIDFSNTTSVKLESIKKEEFWDNSFLPKINNE